MSIVDLSRAPAPPFLPAGSFARHALFDWDRAAYSDVNQEGRRRKIVRMISRAPDAPLRVRHNFQIGSIDSSSGNGPTLHAHDYPEIFIPVRAGYHVDYGITGQHREHLGTYDAFSLPLNVLRTFEADRAAPDESQMLSVFDTRLDDARQGIRVTAAVAAADAAAGLPQDFEVSDELVDFDPDRARAGHVARFAEIEVEEVAGLRRRRLVASGDPRAPLRTPHRIEIDFLEVPAGGLSDAWASDCREVLVALEGEPRVMWNDHPVDMARLDTFSVAPKDLRAIGAPGSERALILRVRDVTNAA